MKTGQPPAIVAFDAIKFQDAASLMALRAWYAGLTARAAVTRYLPHAKAPGQSARGILGRIRRQLVAFAHTRQRGDLAALFEHAQDERCNRASAIATAIEVLRSLPVPTPQISDDIGLWFAPRAVRALRGHGIDTLTDLTVRIPRRRGWWRGIDGLGAASARQVEAFFAAHPQLTERARALIAVSNAAVVVPWEQLRLPHEVDGSKGRFRASRDTCMLKAANDHEAVQAWLALHEAPATQRAYGSVALILQRRANVRLKSACFTLDGVVLQAHRIVQQTTCFRPLQC